MNRRKQRREGDGALELVEEAAHLLRVSSWRALGYYYLGGLPFVLGFLYFWAEMSRSSSAYEHCAPASFGVALLFLWMKTWQAIFAGQLKAQIAGRPASSPRWRRTRSRSAVKPDNRVDARPRGVDPRGLDVAQPERRQVDFLRVRRAHPNALVGPPLRHSRLATKAEALCPPVTRGSSD